jgi:hypothetical protein
VASMRSGLVVALLALGIGATPLPVLAQMKLMMTVERFQKMAARGESGEILIGHYLHSFWLAVHQTHLDFIQKDNQQKRIYCIPADTKLTPKDLRDELLREFVARPELYKPDTPVGPVAVEIIRRRFPCS